MVRSTNTPKVLAFMITRADTSQRIGLFCNTVVSAIDTASMDFDLVIHHWQNYIHNTVGALYNTTRANILDKQWKHNVGQHVIMNDMLAKAKKEGYEYLLRLDDDCKFLTKRYLVKMLDAAKSLGSAFIISPTVLGLKYPPERSDEVEVEGVKVKFLTEAIGGVCRLHNVASLTDEAYPYIADIRGPLGFGDATGIAKWCHNAPKDNRKWMVYLTQVRVKHSTMKQEEEDEAYFKQHDLFQRLPYIPPITD